ncbi:hypothetical protein ACOSQ4_031139 [Xanthoceras sorbifolium]
MGGSMADSSQHDLRLDSRKKMLDAGKETNSKPLVAEKQVPTIDGGNVIRCNTSVDIPIAKSAAATLRWFGAYF